MIEKVGHIKNPLTVIAIFAAIAEISGTTVLPFIDSKNQETYIWFLITFPVFLVSSFFLTLNFNHRVLYAPSDYKYESNFLKMFDKASPEEQEQKLREEVAESSEVCEEAVDNTPNESTETSINSQNLYRKSNKNQQLMANVTLAEKLAVNSLAKKLNLQFKTDVKVQINKRQIFFDAVSYNGDEIHAVEVKLFRSQLASSARFDKILLETENFQRYFSENGSKKLILHLYAVVDNPEIDKHKLKERLERFNSRYDVDARLEVVSLDDLQNEWQCNP
ncbi:hypothetical protein [Halomonas sp. G11]|uniref:hypothetical protein n=1 Tax=Halomonas sp. G11 TaxID=1684425 RepID=UPI0007FCD7AB|nr:hypothetical protein [Halomonas sp. G11]OBA00644.1 hypothetical protein ADS46_09440 [Halomonas sp. G11]